MKKLFCLVFVIIVSVVSVNAEMVQNIVNTAIFNQEQTKQIQQIAHDYIINNPGILIEAGKKLQEQEIAAEKARNEKIKTNILKYKKEIFNTDIPGRSVTGNLGGRTIVVEFTQYQCPHCQFVEPIVDKIIKNNPDVLLITIYWPFFGNDAVYAAKAVLAAQKQGKFNELNRAIWSIQNFATKDKIDSVISSIQGIDAKRLYVDMEDREIQDGIKSNFKLAQDLNLIGAPTFIFTNKEMTKLVVISGQPQSFESDFRRSLIEIQ